MTLNMSRTLIDLAGMPRLENNTPVRARAGDLFFNGRVVGQSSVGVVPCYIVECLDGTFPNDTYPYKFLSFPLSEIFVVDDKTAD